MWAEYVLLAGLLILSGFFSGSETAFFSLDRVTLTQMKGKGRLPDLIHRLASDLHGLLLAILFGNMIINITFFSISYSIGSRAGGTGTVVAGLVSLAALILCGEVIPKLAAAKAPQWVARLCVVPLYLFVRAVQPITDLLVRLPIAKPVTATEAHLNTDELKMLIDLAEKAGEIDEVESDLFAEVVEFGEIVVKETMVPRVDMVGFALPGERDAVRQQIRETGITKLVVWEESKDNVVGYLDGKELVLRPDVPLRDLIRPVAIVPETKKVEALLKEFIQDNARFAVVVDEYGGTEGIVTLEHLLGEIVGDFDDGARSTEEPPVIELEPGRYLLRGNVSIRDWADLFGTHVNAPQLGTLAGLVTKLLGHLPRKGDSVRYGNLLMTVTRVHRHRVTQIMIEGSQRNGHT